VTRRVGLVLVALIAGVLVLDLAAVLGAHRRARTTGAAPASLAAGTAVDKRLGRLPLIDERGRPTSLAAFHGRYVVLAPSLTLCHEVCPLTTGALMRIRRELRSRGLGERVVVAEATVDPWRDSPARVRAFKRRTGADIRFLTGTRSEIRRLWRAFGVEYHRVPQDKPPDIDWWTHRPETFDVTHTDGLFLIDPRGHLRVVVPGMPNVGERLSPRLASLLNDKGQANLRRPDSPWTVDQVLDDLWHLMGRPAARPAAAIPDRAPSPAQVRAELAGSPAPLAALHAQAGRLLGGAKPAVQARLAALRGRPVVVNEWASWCPPCRQEFPLFAAAAARFGARVAFVGLNVNDGADSARRFLAQHPVSYPSYSDDGEAARWLARFAGLPTTVFLNATGKVTSVHIGQYVDAATLARDIERHALRGRG
jgi:cytochrome oxidase Cu insertion factor (SCO1/SenC/PrrC family)/thiol-disulfide isomerase/thioredoxin